MRAEQGFESRYGRDFVFILLQQYTEGYVCFPSFFLNLPGERTGIRQLDFIPDPSRLRTRPNHGCGYT